MQRKRRTELQYQNQIRGRIGGGRGVVIDRVKIWLMSPPKLILGDILMTLAFSEFVVDEKKSLPVPTTFLIYNGKSIFLLL